MFKKANHHAAIQFCDDLLVDYLAERREVSPEPQRVLYFCSADILDDCRISTTEDGNVLSFKSERCLVGSIICEFLDTMDFCTYRYTQSYVLAKGPHGGWLSCWIVGGDSVLTEGVCRSSCSSEGRITSVVDMLDAVPDIRLDIYDRFIESVNTALQRHEWCEGSTHPGSTLERETDRVL